MSCRPCRELGAALQRRQCHALVPEAANLLMASSMHVAKGRPYQAAPYCPQRTLPAGNEMVWQKETWSEQTGDTRAGRGLLALASRWLIWAVQVYRAANCDGTSRWLAYRETSCQMWNRASPSTEARAQISLCRRHAPSGQHLLAGHTPQQAAQAHTGMHHSVRFIASQL